MKTIKINSCYECPYYEQGVSNQAVTIRDGCMHDGGPKVPYTRHITNLIDEPLHIPEWCPLEERKIMFRGGVDGIYEQVCEHTLEWLEIQLTKPEEERQNTDEQVRFAMFHIKNIQETVKQVLRDD